MYTPVVPLPTTLVVQVEHSAGLCVYVCLRKTLNYKTFYLDIWHAGLPDAQPSAPLPETAPYLHSTRDTYTAQLFAQCFVLKWSV